jgi:hypothetical protein
MELLFNQGKNRVWVELETVGLEGRSGDIVKAAIQFRESLLEVVR